jgi:hypothetical protein
MFVAVRVSNVEKKWRQRSIVHTPFAAVLGIGRETMQNASVVVRDSPQFLQLTVEDFFRVGL